MNTKKFSFLILLVSFCLIGCASQTKTGTSYSGDQARQAQTIKMGTVENVKEIEIQSDRTGIGAIAAYNCTTYHPIWALTVITLNLNPSVIPCILHDLLGTLSNPIK